MKKHLYTSLLAFLLGVFIPQQIMSQACFSAVAHKTTEDAFTISLSGNCGDCDSIKVHWINPQLPDRTVKSHQNNWAVGYGPQDGMTPRMLLTNFSCWSSAMEAEVSCVSGANCPVVVVRSITCKQHQVNCPQGTRLIVKNAQGTIVNPLVCVPSGTYIVSPDQSIPPEMSAHWSVNGVTDPGNSSSEIQVTIADGDAKDIAFSATIGSCNVLTSVSLRSCVQTTVTTPPPPTCKNCGFCKGPWYCCIFWALLVVLVVTFVLAFLWIICNPASYQAWIVLGISLAGIILLLWLLTEYCGFDICLLFQLIIAALMVDVIIVCAIDKLIPCVTPAICGVSNIFGVSVRNWGIIMFVLLCLLAGITFICPEINT